MSEERLTRREIIKKAAYVTPAILTMSANFSFASAGSGNYAAGEGSIDYIETNQDKDKSAMDRPDMNQDKDKPAVDVIDTKDQSGTKDDRETTEEVDGSTEHGGTNETTDKKRKKKDKKQKKQKKEKKVKKEKKGKKGKKNKGLKAALSNLIAKII